MRLQGPGNANNFAGARLGAFLENTDAGFMPPQRFLGIKDEEHPGEKGDVRDASQLNQQRLQNQKNARAPLGKVI